MLGMHLLWRRYNGQSHGIIMQYIYEILGENPEISITLQSIIWLRF